MLQSLAVHRTVKGVYDILHRDGVVVLPSKLGYGILALTPTGVDNGRNVASSRMTYGRFLNRLDAGQVTNVDFYEGGPFGPLFV